MVYRTLNLLIFIVLLPIGLVVLLALLIGSICTSSHTSKPKFSDCSFGNAAPHLWNNLPPSLKSYYPCNPTSSSFISTTCILLPPVSFRLKTHIFTLSYPPWLLAYRRRLFLSTGNDITYGMMERRGIHLFNRFWNVSYPVAYVYAKNTYKAKDSGDDYRQTMQNKFA